MIQFFSPEGQALDTLFRESVAMPAIAARDHGVFLTYTHILLNLQILLWMNEDGTIANEDTVDLPGVEFAYAEGSLCRLVTFRQNPWALTETYAIYSFAENAAPVDTVVLWEQTLSQTDLHGGRNFDWDGGVLTVVTAMAHNDPPPLHYTVRILRSQNGEINPLPPWNPGPVPEGSYFFGWSVARGPWNSTVLGFYSAGGGASGDLRFVAFDADGYPNAPSRVLDPGAAYAANALDLLAAYESVYVLYTAQPRVPDSLGGTYFAAFPLDEILDADRTPPPIPQSIGLAAYPNPFNAAVRIEYSLPSGGASRLQVFDLLGRLVADLTPEVRQRQAGQILWSAGDLPSGEYFVSMNYAAGSRTVKLLLLR